MVTSTSLICFLAMSMMTFDGTFGRSTKECNDDGDCGETDFCHYKYKKCRTGTSFTHFYFAFAYQYHKNLPANSFKISKNVLNLYSIKLVYVERRTKHLLGS